VYVGSWDQNLYAITPAGGLKWSYTTGSAVQSSPAIGSDGTIYVGGDDLYMYAIGNINENGATFLENILIKLDQFSLNQVPQEASTGANVTLTPVSSSMVIYTSPSGKVGAVTISLGMSGMKKGYKFTVLYYTDPSHPGAYISKIVSKGTNIRGFTDTAAAWKVQVMVAFPKLIGSVSVTYAYAATYPP
jgi:outer membrane protein assembly factor BamB